jgi:hypothetical protein
VQGVVEQVANQRRTDKPRAAGDQNTHENRAFFYMLSIGHSLSAEGSGRKRWMQPRLENAGLLRVVDGYSCAVPLAHVRPWPGQGRT